ncbi:hypothetical protein CR513_06591, partial [Mucuna pruriens]
MKTGRAGWGEGERKKGGGWGSLGHQDICILRFFMNHVVTHLKIKEIIKRQCLLVHSGVAQCHHVRGFHIYSNDPRSTHSIELIIGYVDVAFLELFCDFQPCDNDSCQFTLEYTKDASYACQWTLIRGVEDVFILKRFSSYFNSYLISGWSQTKLMLETSRERH